MHDRASEPWVEGVSAAPEAHVVSVNVNAVHTFSKAPALEVRLLGGLGVDGDAHCGATVRHRFQRRREPDRPNLRQVHLVQADLLEDLSRLGHVVHPGDLGENVTTAGVDVMGLAEGTVLRLGGTAEVELTGLRTPCQLVNGFQPGLMTHLWVHDDAGRRARRAGVMSVVRTGGVVRPGDPLFVVQPEGPHRPLLPV